MGLAASQCRLLLLTSRKSDLELRAQNITNKKLLLSMESEQISSEYSRALNEKILMFSYATDGSNGTNQSVTLSYGVLTAKLNEGLSRQKRLVTEAGQIVAKGADDPVLQSFLNININGQEYPAGYLEPLYNDNGAVIGGVVRKLDITDTGNASNTACQNFWANLDDTQKANLESKLANLTDEQKASFKNISLPDEGRVVIFLGDDLDNTYVLQNALRMGTLLIEEGSYPESNEINDETGTKETDDNSGRPRTWTNLTWQGDASFWEKSDDSAYSRATAIYETKTSRVQIQEKKLDMELKQIETQRKACETEIDAVKKVAEDGITKTFKYFQG